MVKKNHTLDEAMAALIQNQAAFVAELRETNAELRETNREMVQLKRTSDERFARIESMLAGLATLPDKVKEEIAFGFAAWRKQESK